MKKYPYVPTDLVKAVDSVLDKRQNVIGQDLRERYNLQEAMALPLPTEKSVHDNLSAGIQTHTLVTAFPQFAESWLKNTPVNHENWNNVLASVNNIRSIQGKKPFDVFNESAVVGVIKGQLPGNQHMCATKIFSEQFGEGTPVYSMHADPDEHGLIEWYDVMFEHGIERVFTEDVEVLAEMSHGDDHDDDKKKRGKKHKKSRMKKEKDDEDDDDMKMESNGYADVDAALADMGEIKAFNDANPTKRRRARTPTRYRKNVDIFNANQKNAIKRMQRGASTLARNLQAESKEEPADSDIEKSLSDNAIRSGYHVALKTIDRSGFPNKGELKQAISQAVEHRQFGKQMRVALSKAQNTEEVLEIAANFLKSQEKPKPSLRRMSWEKTNESVDIVKSVMKRLKESREVQSMLPFDTGLADNELHNGYQYRDGWTVVHHPDDNKSGFRTLQRITSSGKIHIVHLPDDVRTVGDLQQHLLGNPETETHTPPASGDGAYTVKPRGNLFQTVAFDPS